MKHLTIFLALLIAFSGCRPKKTITEVPVQTKTLVKDRLVPVVVPNDSATLDALFECDSLNQVRLKQIEELKGKSVKSETKFAENKLVYKTKYLHDTVYVHAQDSIIEREIPIKVPVPYEVNVVTGVQWFQIYLGRIFAILLVLFLGYKLIRSQVKLPY